MVRVEYNGKLSYFLNGKSYVTGETAEVNEETVQKLLPNDWRIVKEKANPKTKKTEVDKNGEDLEIKRSNDKA